MADKEINIKVTANTDDAKKGIAEVTNELEKMSTSGSGKAADELDKVASSADKASKMTDELSKKYEEWGAAVKKAEGVSRLINANQFKDAETRDMILAKHQEELDRLLQMGTELASSMREIGIEPRQLESFVTYADVLSRANREFEIAINNKERLLNQPKVPIVPPGGDDPDDPEGNEFKRKYAAYAADIAEYQKQLEITTAATDRFKEALRVEYSALDENAEGYLQKKQLLERLISQAERYTAAQGTLTQGIKTQIATFEELYAQTAERQSWQKGIAELEKLAPTVERNAQKVRITMQNAVGLQNSYNNAIIKGQDAEIKGWQKVQASMEVAGKSRTELIRLVEEYGKALANAKTAEEYEAAAAGISAARKQLTLLTREASLTGSAMIGTQTSVQGLVTTIGTLGTQGRLTFMGLAEGIKLFAKSTLVLAGIQFAWEALSKIYEKVKGDLFGVAESEEEAAAKAERLAEAARDANAALRDSQMALSAWRDDQARAVDATAFADALKSQNEQYAAQIKLIQKATEAKLHDAAITAKDEEREIAFERLELQQKKIDGTISELAYKKAIIELERRAAISKIDLTKKKSAIDKENAENELTLAQDNLNRIRNTERKSLEGFEQEPEKVKEAIDAYNELDATVKENNKEFGRLTNRQHELDKSLEKYKKLGFDKSASSLIRLIYDKAQTEWYRNQIKLNEFRAQENALIRARENLPKIVREYGINEKGLSQYTKTRKGILDYNKPLDKEEEEAKKDVAKKAAAKEKKDAEDARIQAESTKEISAAFEVAKLKTDNAVKEKKQADKDKKNQEEIKAIKESIHSLSIAELRKQEADLKAKAKKTKSSRNRDRIRARAAVYSDEINSRNDEMKREAGTFIPGLLDASAKSRISQGKKASKYITSGLSPDTRKEAENINNLSGIAQDVVKSGRVRENLISRINSAVETVKKTKGADDDIALERIVELLSQVVKTTEKNAHKARKYSNEIKSIKRRIANLDA